MTTAAIRDNYRRVASAYAGSWAETLAVHGRALAERVVQPTSVRRVAELGCGPGLVLSELARLAPQARVLGADLTEEMLRLAPAQFDRVAADVQALPFRSDVFDAVLMPFVLFHLPDLPLALSEVRRTLATGGAFGAVTWARHDPHPAYDVWVRVIDDHGAPPDPSPQMPSNETTSDPHKLRIALQTAGFGDVEITVERFHHQPGASEFLEHAKVVGAMARRVEQLPADRRAACLAAAERELSKLDAEAFVESGTVLYATASVGD